MLRRLRDWSRPRQSALSLVLLGGILRLIHLNARSLWADEASTLFIAQSPLSLVAPRVAALEENPPLHYLLMHFWTFWFSDPVFGLRLFSALCGMASLLLFLLLCERLIPRQAGDACFLAAVSSFWIHFSQDGRIYGLLLLVSLSATWALLELDERWTGRRASLYAFLAAAGLYTHNFFVFVLLGHGAHLLLKRKPLKRWLALYAAVLALYAPWIGKVLSQIQLLSRASVLTEPLTWRSTAYVLGTMVCDTSFVSLAHPGLTIGLGSSVLALLALGVLLARGRLGDGAAFCAVQLAAGFLGLGALELAMNCALTQARCLIFLSPFLYMLVAAIFDRVSDGWSRFLRGPAAAVLAAGSFFYFVGGIIVDPQLALLAGRLRQLDSRLPIVHLDPYYYLPMRYHYLPERAHHMAGPDFPVHNWEKLPGYRAYLTRRELSGVRLVAALDPRHVYSPDFLAVAPGAAVAKAAYK